MENLILLFFGEIVSKFREVSHKTIKTIFRFSLDSAKNVVNFLFRFFRFIGENALRVAPTRIALFFPTAPKEAAMKDTAEKFDIIFFPAQGGGGGGGGLRLCAGDFSRRRFIGRAAD